jgi:hypothetical protein
MGEGLLGRHIVKFVTAAVQEGAAAGGEDQLPDFVGGATAEALGDGAVLGIDRDDLAGLGSCLDQRAAHDRARELGAHRAAPLLGHEALLGIAGLANGLLEAHGVERAGGRLEAGLGGDPARDLGVGKAEPQRARPLVEGDLGGQLRQDLAVEAERARLIRGDRPADLAADLLQLIVVDPAELLGGDLGLPHLGGGGEAETAEDVAAGRRWPGAGVAAVWLASAGAYGPAGRGR